MAWTSRHASSAGYDQLRQDSGPKSIKDLEQCVVTGSGCHPKNTSSRNRLCSGWRGAFISVGLVLLGLHFLLPSTLLRDKGLHDLDSMESLRSGFERAAALQGDFDLATPKTHLAIVATKSTTNFCKTLFSALANGYDPPNLVHFNKTFARGHGDKVFRYNDYLHSGLVTNSDSVLLIDGYDVWFQLPEVVARQRYLQLGKELVVGADKKCWPNAPNSKACTAWPESTLDKDIYGDWTDKEGMHEYARPRWLNSGTLYGTLDALQRLFTETSKRAALRTDKSFHDQEVLADVLVEGTTAINYTADFSSHLFQTMTFAHHDITWEVNPDPLSPPSTPYKEGCGEDDETVVLMSDAAELGLLHPQERHLSFWFNRPLARNKMSNKIPASLHFNGRKSFIRWWWKRMWFSQLQTREQLLTTFQTDGNPGQAGAWDGHRWLSWTDLCGTENLFA